MQKTPLTALVTAEIVSILGSRMTYLALPWFVLVTTGSPAKMSVVLAVEILPMALLRHPERHARRAPGRRTTMLVCDAARAPLLASIPLLHAADLLSFPLLLVLVFALGCFMAPYFAAQRVILPELVGEDEQAIAQANSVIEGGTAFAGLAGPALAGILIPFLGAPNVLYVDAATYVVSFLLLAGFVPKTRRIARRRGPARRARRDQVHAARPASRPLSGTVIVLNFLGSGLSAVLPYYAYDSFSGDSKVAGLFFTAMGAGALVGSLAAVLVIKRVQPLRLAAFAIVALTLPLWLLPLDLPAWGVMAALFVGDAVHAARERAGDRRHHGADSGRAAAEDDDRADLDQHPRHAAWFPRRRAAARAVGRSKVLAAVAVGMTATALVFAAIALRAGETVPEAVTA